eukprot:gnl/MRDRNA2_/MRDRNA2_240413_c0_seq1.p1 gnl/MRDRNA2_/MRDRNA2_240413_c0~~gnl/MRDRNA2_/MRDRNA2_240413_c0_seq1.p1  ORF type:complete len:191 (-),score=15.91 gnl/MRDRNA2_/MRDRNA2_240413_c0_seq1:124-696(-)
MPCANHVFVTPLIHGPLIIELTSAVGQRPVHYRTFSCRDMISILAMIMGLSFLITCHSMLDEGGQRSAIKNHIMMEEAPTSASRRTLGCGDADAAADARFISEIEDDGLTMAEREGTVTRFMQEKGFGFIKPADTFNLGQDLFFHSRALVDWEGSVNDGDKVSYNPIWSSCKRNWAASNVRFISSAEQAS